jgi:hypothetical protein
MKKTFAGFAAQLWQSVAHAAPVPHECTKQQLLGFAPSRTQVEAHRTGKCGGSRDSPDLTEARSNGSRGSRQRRRTVALIDHARRDP